MRTPYATHSQTSREFQTVKLSVNDTSSSSTGFDQTSRYEGSTRRNPYASSYSDGAKAGESAKSELHRAIMGILDPNDPNDTVTNDEISQLGEWVANSDLSPADLLGLTSFLNAAMRAGKVDDPEAAKALVDQVIQKCGEAGREAIERALGRPSKEIEEYCAQIQEGGITQEELGALQQIKDSGQLPDGRPLSATDAEYLAKFLEDHKGEIQTADTSAADQGLTAANDRLTNAQNGKTTADNNVAAAQAKLDELDKFCNEAQEANKHGSWKKGKNLPGPDGKTYSGKELAEMRDQAAKALEDAKAAQTAAQGELDAATAAQKEAQAGYDQAHAQQGVDVDALIGGFRDFAATHRPPPLPSEDGSSTTAQHLLSQEFAMRMLMQRYGQADTGGTDHDGSGY